MIVIPKGTTVRSTEENRLQGSCRADGSLLDDKCGGRKKNA